MYFIISYVCWLLCCRDIMRLMMRRAVSDLCNCGVLDQRCQFGIVHRPYLLLHKPFAESKPSFSHNINGKTAF